jgi:DNA-binding Xre family transcriptional regulator
MHKIKKNEATIAIENLINSQEYKEYHEKQHASRLILARMQEIMEQKKITQEELANRMEMKQSSISRLLSGNRPNFSVETLLKFCNATKSNFTLL